MGDFFNNAFFLDNACWRDREKMLMTNNQKFHSSSTFCFHFSHNTTKYCCVLKHCEYFASSLPL